MHLRRLSATGVYMTTPSLSPVGSDARYGPWGVSGCSPGSVEDGVEAGTED